MINMSKHRSVSKFLRDVVKDNQQRRDSKTLMKAAGDRSRTKIESEQQQLQPHEIEACAYCSKAFYETNSLLKHLLRSHPNHLLRIHNEHLAKINAQPKSRTNHEAKVKSSKTIGKEVIELKKLLKEFKLEVVNHLRFIHQRCEEHVQPPIREKEPVKTQKTPQKSNSDEIKKFHTELGELKVKCQRFEMLIQNFEEKYKVSQATLQREICLNEEKREQNDIEIRKLVKNTCHTQKKEINMLRDELEKQLVSLQHIILNEVQKQCSDVDKKITKVQNQHACDVERLNSHIEKNSKNLEKIANDDGVEEMLEKKLKRYLKKVEKNESKRKHVKNKPLMPNTSLVSNVQSSSRERISLADQNQLHSFNHKNFQTAQIFKESGNETVRLSQHSVFKPIQGNPNKKIFITKRVKMALKQNPNFLQSAFEEANHQYENKLLAYGIQPGQVKLSMSEFNAKKTLLNHELTHSSSKHDLLTLKHDIDNMVNAKVKSFTSKSKKKKRISFAKSTNAALLPTLGNSTQAGDPINNFQVSEEIFYPTISGFRNVQNDSGKSSEIMMQSFQRSFIEQNQSSPKSKRTCVENNFSIKLPSSKSSSPNSSNLSLTSGGKMKSYLIEEDESSLKLDSKANNEPQYVRSQRELFAAAIGDGQGIVEEHVSTPLKLPAVNVMGDVADNSSLSSLDSFNEPT